MVLALVYKEATADVVGLDGGAFGAKKTSGV